MINVWLFYHTVDQTTLHIHSVERICSDVVLHVLWSGPLVPASELKLRQVQGACNQTAPSSAVLSLWNLKKKGKVKGRKGIHL